eukprot:403369334
MEESVNHKLNDANSYTEDNAEFTEIYVWGRVGLEQTIHHMPKICSFNIVINYIACGDEHTAFIAEQVGHVYCMGSNADGKLGIGEKTLKSSNVPCLVEGIQDIVQVACGSQHTMALNRKGEIYAWGGGFYGALGLGDARMCDKPQIIQALQHERIVDIAAGNRHSLFLAENQRVYGCGESKAGQLGLGQGNQHDRILSPQSITALSGQGVKKVCCGKFHSLFLTHSKEVFSTGGNSFGQLGTGNQSNLYVPEKIKNLSKVNQISAWQYSAAITEQDELFVWGTGIFGEYLIPTQQHFPKDKCQTSQFKSIQIGGSFSVLIDHQNKAYVWGANTNNEIGSGDSQPKLYPTILSCIQEKESMSVGVGNNFAFVLGPLMRGGDNFQSYATEEIPPTLNTQQFDMKFNQTSQVTEFFDTQIIEQNKSDNQRNIQTRNFDSYDQKAYEKANQQVIQDHHNDTYQVQYKYKPNQMTYNNHNKPQFELQSFADQQQLRDASEKISKQEKQIQDLQYSNIEQERAIKLLKDENNQLKINENKQRSEIDNLKSQIQGQQIYKDEIEKYKRKIQALKDENNKLKKDNDDLNYLNTRLQKEKTDVYQKKTPNRTNGNNYHTKNAQTHNQRPSESANTTTIDFNSPNTHGFNHKLDEDLGSPITTINQNDLTTLKIEDLEENMRRTAQKKQNYGVFNNRQQQKPKDNYNPVWKLQITDDKNKVQYEGNFIDRNNANHPVTRYDPYDEKPINRLHYDYTNDRDFKNLDRKNEELIKNRGQNDGIARNANQYHLPQFGDGIQAKKVDQPISREQVAERFNTEDRYDLQKRKAIDYKGDPYNINDKYQKPADMIGQQRQYVFSDDRDDKKQRERLYYYENRKEFDEAQYKRQYDENERAQHKADNKYPKGFDNKHYEPVTANRLDYNKYQPPTQAIPSYQDQYKPKGFSTDYEPVSNVRDQYARGNQGTVERPNRLIDNQNPYLQKLRDEDYKKDPLPINNYRRNESAPRYTPPPTYERTYDLQRQDTYERETEDINNNKFKINLQPVQPNTNPTSPSNAIIGNIPSFQQQKPTLNLHYQKQVEHLKVPNTQNTQNNQYSGVNGTFGAGPGPSIGGTVGSSNSGNKTRVDEIRQKLDKFKQQRDETNKLVQNYRKN